MVPSYSESFRQKRHAIDLERHTLLRQHPVLTPMLLLSSSITLAVVSLFTNTLFPILTIVGISSTRLCLSLAFVLGVAGILSGIIGLIERVNRYSLQAVMFPKSKEQGYANRN